MRWECSIFCSTALAPCQASECVGDGTLRRRPWDRWLALASTISRISFEVLIWRLVRGDGENYAFWFTSISKHNTQVPIRPFAFDSKSSHGLSENSFAVRPVTRSPPSASAAAASPARFMSRKKSRFSPFHSCRRSIGCASPDSRGARWVTAKISSASAMQCSEH